LPAIAAANHSSIDEQFLPFDRVRVIDAEVNLLDWNLNRAEGLKELVVGGNELGIGSLRRPERIDRRGLAERDILRSVMRAMLRGTRQKREKRAAGRIWTC
jgi:hypothetical protein